MHVGSSYYKKGDLPEADRRIAREENRRTGRKFLMVRGIEIGG